MNDPLTALCLKENSVNLGIIYIEPFTVETIGAKKNYLFHRDVRFIESIFSENLLLVQKQLSAIRFTLCPLYTISALHYIRFTLCPHYTMSALERFLYNCIKIRVI